MTTRWTGKMVVRLRQLAAERLSGRQIAYSLNVEFGAFLSADAVRRQAATYGIKLHGKRGAPKGNTNANGNSFARGRSANGRFSATAFQSGSIPPY